MDEVSLILSFLVSQGLSSLDSLLPRMRKLVLSTLLAALSLICSSSLCSLFRAIAFRRLVEINSQISYKRRYDKVPFSPALIQTTQTLKAFTILVRPTEGLGQSRLSFVIEIS